ncbi:hypothetical protein HOO65_021135 [Ceratocystis lukuohia]|uniref:Uncharacterized protein n=1 Tax=Ceratocystis lukuohia TaxID=2019550 RepID=A0ABR4MQM3_9PEZI
MAYPRVNGNHLPSSATAVSPLDTSPSSATEQNVPAEDPSIFPATSPEVDAHDTPNSAVAAPPPNTTLPSSTEQGVPVSGQQIPPAAEVVGSKVSSHSPSHDAATSSSAVSSSSALRYLPPGVRRCVSNFSDRRINIYGIPRSAVRAASSYASPYSVGEGQGLDSTSSNRELLITLYGQARLPGWLRKLSPQGTHFIARKMVDSAFPVPKKQRFFENDGLPNGCRVVNGLPRMLEGVVVDGYTSFKHFLLCEKHRLPIDLVYSIAHASAHNVNQSMGEVHNLSKSLITHAESLFQKWEGKVQSDAEELADEFDFKTFCGMAYKLWKCIIEECPSYYLTSFPQAPDICGLRPPDFFKLLVPHFLHEETDCRVPITCLHHIFADLLEDAQKAFKDVVDVSDTDAATEMDLVADVVFCDKRDLASPSTVLRHQTLFAIFRKIAFIIQTAGAWEFLFSYCSIVDGEVEMEKFVQDTDIDFTKLSVEKSLVIIASRFCVVLERPDLLKRCWAFVHGIDMKPSLNYAVILRHCVDSKHDAFGVHNHSRENPSLVDTIEAGTIYVPARLRVFLISSVLMALGILYLWISIRSASDDRFGNHVSLILLLAGAVLGIGPGIMRRGWTFYDFVRWRMPISGTSELGSRAYITALTVAKTYGFRISGPYNGVFPDLYRSAGGSLRVDVPIRLDDAQQHNTINYSIDYDGVLVVRLHDKMTRMYPNRVNFFSREVIQTDPLGHYRRIWNLQQELKDGLIA